MAVVTCRTMLDRRHGVGEAAPRRGSHTVPEMSHIWRFLPRESSFSLTAWVARMCLEKSLKAEVLKELWPSLCSNSIAQSPGVSISVESITGPQVLNPQESELLHICRFVIVSHPQFKASALDGAIYQCPQVRRFRFLNPTLFSRLLQNNYCLLRSYTPTRCDLSFLWIFGASVGVSSRHP